MGKAKSKAKKVVTSGEAIRRKADAYLDASSKRFRAKLALREAERAEREAERQLARLVPAGVRAGGTELAGWLVNWWNNFPTSPRESRGLPCVTAAAEIPADAEPLPESEGGAE